MVSSTLVSMSGDVSLPKVRRLLSNQTLPTANDDFFCTFLSSNSVCTDRYELKIFIKYICQYWGWCKLRGAMTWPGTNWCSFYWLSHSTRVVLFIQSVLGQVTGLHLEPYGNVFGTNILYLGHHEIAIQEMLWVLKNKLDTNWLTDQVRLWFRKASFSQTDRQVQNSMRESYMVLMIISDSCRPQRISSLIKSSLWSISIHCLHIEA